ncbi:MAG: hypothetical protein FD149_961 [Rhodospirillaceae bacterium]|nr:MAG: hypothetical protein FD149_961 [Rhodospirillaceae bacterium]
MELLGRVNAMKILEVGPALGAVTALLRNAGYSVTTLDRIPRNFEDPDSPHLQKNLLDVDASDISGYGAIVCCETLEHIPYSATDKVLRTFHDSEARYVVLSVPYIGFQVTFDLYFNAHTFRHYFSMKKLLFLKSFTPEPEFEHQWEIGYRRYSLKEWERKIRAAGFNIRAREFSEHCRSVFHLLDRSDDRCNA